MQARLNLTGVGLGLGDLNNDGDISPRIGGNVVRKVEPSVVLLPGSNQAAIEGDQLQNIVTLFRHNRFGEMTSMVDEEANVHTYAYFPEADADGDGIDSPEPADGRTLDGSTGGYLKDQVIDTASNPIRNNRTNPPPTNIRASCCGTITYDDVGNRTSITDGRGIRTNFFVNELNQVVLTVRAAAVPAVGSGDPPEPLPLTAFAYRENIFYDFNNNVTRREIEDRGNTSHIGGLLITPTNMTSSIIRLR